MEKEIIKIDQIDEWGIWDLEIDHGEKTVAWVQVMNGKTVLTGAVFHFSDFGIDHQDTQEERKGKILDWVEEQEETRKELED